MRATAAAALAAAKNSLPKTSADVRYPITTALAETFGGRLGNKKLVRRSKGENQGITYRVDVVSEALCDDTIKYLAPTLEQHKGCTIIDVHPGACLWSSKLHDFLQPQRHILMEPEERYYEPFIKPLLDQPGSKYRHTTLTGASATVLYWGNYKKVMRDPEMFPPRPLLAHGDPRRRRLDPSVLVIGNLFRHYKVGGLARNNVNRACQLLQQMTWATLTNDFFNENGLVRMLWWFPDAERPNVTACNEHFKSGYNLGLNLGASVTEAVGITPLLSLTAASTNYGRIPLMEAVKVREVQESMQKAEMQLPEGRTCIVPELETTASTECDVISPFASPLDTIEKLQQSIEKVEARLKRIQKWPQRNYKKAVDEEARWGLETLEFPQCLPACRLRNMPSEDRMAILLDLVLRIVRLEANIKTLEAQTQDTHSLDVLRERIKRLDDDYLAFMDARSKEISNCVMTLLDEQVSFFASPSSSPRDRRPYEMMRAHEHEFWPNAAFALLDVTPVERDLSVPDIANAWESTKICQELLKLLFSSKAHTLPWALDRVSPNAAQDLIPQVPAITDPRKGGRLNPNNFRVRMLTEEMVEGLVKAFIEWPFRPSTWQLELADASASADEEDSTETRNSISM